MATGLRQRLPGAWHYHLERATFDAFAWRGRAGQVHFRGQRPTEQDSFRQRLWPVFWRTRPPRQTTEAWHRRRVPLAMILYERSMEKAHRIERARRWRPQRPLVRHWDRMDEAIEQSRRTYA